MGTPGGLAAGVVTVTWLLLAERLPALSMA
jgi:hypothetical protein